MNLVNEQFWCPSCKQWHNAIHMNCAVNGRVQVDLESGHHHCLGCGHTWAGENTGLYCNERHVGNVEYQDAKIGTAVTEEYLVTDGEQVFLITTAAGLEEAIRYFTNIRGNV